MTLSLLVAARSRWRVLVIPALLLAAAAHLPVIRPHLQEAPYLGALFILLSAACVLLASVLISWDPPLLYALAALTGAAAVLGYAATRLVAFPMLADDVGRWLDPLGILAVAAETLTVLAAAAALRNAAAPSSPARIRRRWPAGSTPTVLPAEIAG